MKWREWNLVLSPCRRTSLQVYSVIGKFLSSLLISIPPYNNTWNRLLLDAMFLRASFSTQIQVFDITSWSARGKYSSSSSLNLEKWVFAQSNDIESEASGSSFRWGSSRFWSAKRQSTSNRSNGWRAAIKDSWFTLAIWPTCKRKCRLVLPLVFYGTWYHFHLCRLFRYSYSSS